MVRTPFATLLMMVAVLVLVVQAVLEARSGVRRPSMSDCAKGT